MEGQHGFEDFGRVGWAKGCVGKGVEGGFSGREGQSDGLR